MPNVGIANNCSLLCLALWSTISHSSNKMFRRQMQISMNNGIVIYHPKHLARSYAKPQTINPEPLTQHLLNPKPYPLNPLPFCLSALNTGNRLHDAIFKSQAAVGS
jgi:hypothetical protein